MLRNALIFIVLTLPLLLGAQVSDEHDDLLREANVLFEEGSYVSAHPLFSQLVSLYPKNADFNFKFGACALQNGDDKSKAIKHLTYATKKGADPRSFYHLGRAYHLNYEFKAAKESYQDFERKADSKVVEDFDASRQIAMCEFGSTLLSSMTDLVVMDKQETSDQDFFRYFDMENVGGKILVAPEELQSKADKKRKHRSVIHFPGDKSILYFSSYGKDSSNGLDIYQATRLPDGTFTDINPIKGSVNTQYDEDFPYFHPDGKTMYFASKGHNSMGGYDIFKSTLNGSGQFGIPKNMDFAINTPDDDIFYIADSLNNSAWFASGRSSANGNLHVYNVLVQGLPSVLIYLDGMFISEIDPDIRKARIVVTDELTDRPIAEIYSDSFNGDYLLSIPKPGLYKFSVEAEDSPIRHEGVVEIPVFDESVALRQELRLVAVNGQQKLIIQNFFDEPLDTDLALLVQETLRTKAALDVNATEELIARVKAQEGPALTIKKDLANAALTAGFAEGSTIEQVITDGKEDIQKIEDEVQIIEDNSDLAYSYAEDLRRGADKKLIQAEARLNGVDNDNMPEYFQALIDYTQLVQEAEALSVESYVAMETADRAIAFAQREKQRIAELAGNFGKIETAVANGEFDVAVEGLRQEKDRLNVKGADVGRDPKADVLALADMKEDEQQRALQRVSQFREDERLLINAERRLETSLEKTTKKSARAKIENELVQVREELTITHQNISNEAAKATDLGSAEDLFRREAEFYDLLVGENQQFGLDPSKIKIYDTSDKELLAAEIESTKTRVAILTIEDEETLALIGEDSRGARNDATRLASIQARAIEQNMVLNSMSEIWQGYERQLLSSGEMDPTTSSHRERILAKKTIDQIDEHLAMYNDVRADMTDVQEIKTLDQEIQSLQSLRNDLLNSTEGPEFASRNYTPDEIREAYASISPDYQSEISRIVNQDRPELDKSLDLQLLKKTTRDQLTQAVSNNELIIVKSSDGQTVANLSAQNDLYQQAILQLTAEIDDVDQFKAAYETDTKDIIESEEIVLERLNEQIELTESYISMLDVVSASTQREIEGKNDGDRIKALTDMLAVLQEEREAAGLKLDTYESDLSLTLATDSQPLADVDTDEEATVDYASTEVEIAPENTAADLSLETRGDSVAIDVPVEELLSSLTPVGVDNLVTEYSSDWIAMEGEYRSVVERNRAKIDLNEELIEAADAAIIERVLAMDQIGDEEAKDQIQEDIQRLEYLKNEKNALNENLESQILEFEALETDGETDFASSESATDPSHVAADRPAELTPELEEEFYELFQRPKNLDPTEIYESGLLDEMLAENDDPELQIINRPVIYQLQQEVALMKAEMIGAPENKLKKLDKQIERKYQDLADEEIKNAGKITRLSQVRYDHNMGRINALSAEMSEIVSENDWLMKEVQHLLRKAESERDEAELIRQIAAPEIDEIKQNYLFREAFLFDMNAIKYQEKVMAIYENAELLASQEEEYLVTIKSGEIPVEADVALDDTAEDIDVPSFVDRENIGASGFNRSEPIENRTVALADVINRNRMRELIAVDHDLSAEQLVELEGQPELVSYLREVSDLGSYESERSALINERNELARESMILEQRIKLLISALEVAEEDSEKEGLQSEMETIVSSAQVLYQKIDDKESEIHLKTLKVVDLGERLKTVYSELDLDGLAAEIKNEDDLAIAEGSILPTVEPSVELETERDLSALEVDAPVEIDAPIIVETVIDLAHPRVESGGELTPDPSDSARGFSMPSAAGDFTNFESPEFLNEEIFVRLDDAAYSESNPIPVDAIMPRGVVYKVQVGAFRNLIPQDHFDEFAPMAAEELNNGITRYTAGLFPYFEGADDAKVDIRGMGYSDAFVVAFRDGVRISLTDAKSSTGEELIVSNDGPAVRNTPSESPARTTTTPETASTNTITRPAADEAVSAEEARDYYESYTDAAEATQVEALSGLFYTVQIGVYSKPVPARDLFHIRPLNSELIDQGRIRYSSGRYNSLIDASVKKEGIRATGITDAFVTAYYNGKRIGVAAASGVLQNEGIDELEVSNTLERNETPVVSKTFDIYIGSFENEVPAEVAKAMLFLEESWGIFQISEGVKTTYFTGRILSAAQAQAAVKAFEDYGVEDVRVRAFKKDVEVPFTD